MPARRWSLRAKRGNPSRSNAVRPWTPTQVLNRFVPRDDRALDLHHALGHYQDNPYGQLWFDQPPPAALSAHWPEGSIYMGSFSKILAPGLRLGFLAAPRSVYPKLLQAKQAADLHTASFNQRVVAQLL